MSSVAVHSRGCPLRAQHLCPPMKSTSLGALPGFGSMTLVLWVQRTVTLASLTKCSPTTPCRPCAPGHKWVAVVTGASPHHEHTCRGRSVTRSPLMTTTSNEDTESSTLRRASAVSLPSGTQLVCTKAFTLLCSLQHLSIEARRTAHLYPKLASVRLGDPLTDFAAGGLS